MEIKDWQCTISKFTVGFGENEEESLTDAVNKKNGSCRRKSALS